MWDLFLIFAAKYPFLITLTPFFFALLINSFLKSKFIKSLLLCGGLFASLFFGIFLHIRWDSFSIHFLDQNFANIRYKSVLFIGDSITCEGRRPRGFITKFEAVLPLKTEVVCAKGALTNIIAKNVKTSRINYQPDFIIFQSGINDLINAHHRETIRKDQLKLETEIQECTIRDKRKANRIKKSLIKAVFKTSPLPKPEDDKVFVRQIFFNIGAH